MPSQSAETKVVIVSVCVCVHGHHYTDQKLPMAIAHCANFHTQRHKKTHTIARMLCMRTREKEMEKTNIIEINSHKWHIDPDIVHRTRLAYFQR